ncbi:MAG: DUF4124 domain-containing protein [Burkholderiales bacterium]|nr:DUF4124 domain-containing protein [Burkholderiales bacterium]
MVRPVGLLLAGVLSLGLAAQAQVYKNVMPDGRIIYSDAPLKGAKSSPVNVPPPPTEADKAKAQQRALEEAQKREALKGRLDDRRKKLDDADERVKQARQALANAQAALEQGRTPLPGEMIGTVGAGARPSEGYLNRIAGLEKAVETAKKALDDALYERNQAR